MSYRIYIDDAVFHDGDEYSEMVSSLYEQIYDLEDRQLQPEIRSSREEISMLLAADFVEFEFPGADSINYKLSRDYLILLQCQ